jgi:hypothetical protein
LLRTGLFGCFPKKKKVLEQGLYSMVMDYLFLYLACLVVSVPVTSTVIISRLKWRYLVIEEIAAAIQLSVLLRLVGTALAAAAVSLAVILGAHVGVFYGFVIALIVPALGGFIVRLPTR